jgi:hypothetical protein
MSDALQRLLERLQTGWQPSDEELAGAPVLNDWIPWEQIAFGEHSVMVLGLVDGSDQHTLSPEVLYIDPDQRFVLTDGGFYRLGALFFGDQDD